MPLASSVPLALVLVALAGLGASGCDLERKQREQRQIEHLCWLEGRLRGAANPDKAAFLGDLSRAPCPAPDACELRDGCVAAYTLHVDALNLTGAARQQLADGQGDQAARLLGAAETKLKAAGPAVERCTQLAADVRRAHKIN